MFDPFHAKSFEVDGDFFSSLNRANRIKFFPFEFPFQIKWNIICSPLKKTHILSVRLSVNMTERVKSAHKNVVCIAYSVHGIDVPLFYFLRLKMKSSFN